MQFSESLKDLRVFKVAQKVDYESRTNNLSLVEMNNYYRFLLSMSEDVTPEQFPPWKLYRIWTLDFPGWLYGKLDKNSPAWSAEYEGFDLPMNNFYKEERKDTYVGATAGNNSTEF